MNSINFYLLNSEIFLSSELKEYRERLSDGSMYYKESFGISPEMAIDNAEKLQQMEELVSSLEAEVFFRHLVSFFFSLIFYFIF